jgi:predicted  nucleic acid-binding Zn-ribbon protein
VDHTKINLIVRLQHIDNMIESIMSLQKGLPEEISALEEDLAFTSRQIEARKKIADEHQKLRERLNGIIHDCKEKIKSFKEKQTLARNNKEYDALSKQIEYEEKEIAQAEIQLQDISQAEHHAQELQKKGRELIAENRYDEISEEMMPDDVLQQQMEDLGQQVRQKKEELESIVVETAEEVTQLKEVLSEQRSAVAQQAKRLLDKYDHLKSGSMQNAVVKLDRQACSGCNTRVPTNRHTLIVQGGFYVCESCGRIVVHERLFDEAAASSQQ